jgi:hypothetical protein
LNCGHHLAVAIKPGQADLQGGLGLEGAPLLHQLVALQCDLLLQVDGARIECGSGFNESGRDGAECFKDFKKLDAKIMKQQNA